ncbi:hypothetical protein JOM49_001720 [Amycolatopsis magusensis]|uniref:Uncharacterized protein n=1 Tax=Amycolatopsis magusensis TaxID=882444 RepID=A0ABS4PL90_9PSEU|nr:hypothetical protein [Amycolatopsis magusensis]
MLPFRLAKTAGDWDDTPGGGDPSFALPGAG